MLYIEESLQILRNIFINHDQYKKTSKTTQAVSCDVKDFPKSFITIHQPTLESIIFTQTSGTKTFAR